jgi:hypothetical protein
MDVENCLNLTPRDVSSPDSYRDGSEQRILIYWNVSSVGSERCFDRAEVTGSSPVRSTLWQLCTFYIHSLLTSTI